MARREKMVRRTVYLPPKMNRAAKKAAAVVQANTGEEVAVAELIRRGLHRELMAIQAGATDPPEGYEAE